MIFFFIVSSLYFIYYIYLVLNTNRHITIIDGRELPFKLPDIQYIPNILHEKQLKEQIYIIGSGVLDPNKTRIESTHDLVEKINKIDPVFSYKILQTITSKEPKQIIYEYRIGDIIRTKSKLFVSQNWCRLFAYDDTENVMIYGFFKVFNNNNIINPNDTQREIGNMIDYENLKYNSDDEESDSD